MSSPVLILLFAQLRTPGCQMGLGFLIASVCLLCTGAPARAQVQFTQTTQNAGTIKSGVPLAREFPFAVAGTEAIEILEVRPSCGCVTSEMPRKTFAPGEEGKITLSVHTLGEGEGPHRWYLYVFYQQGMQQQQVALQVLADVVAEVLVQPARLNIHTTGALTETIRLTDCRPQPLTIQEVRTSAPFLHVALGKTARNERGRWNTDIEIKVEDAVPAGRSETQVNIYTDDPLYPHLQVPVVITRPSSQRYRATPAEIQLKGTRGQPMPARLALISDTRDEEVHIAAIRTDHPALQCHWAPGPGTLATIRIQVDAAKIKGSRLESALHIDIAGPEKETITIPVTCILE